MKKFYFTVLALIFLSAFVKAQEKKEIKAYTFPSVILTEEIIAERLNEARAKGTQEWEIATYKTGLERLMKSQQHNLLFGNNQKSTPPQVQAACTNVDFESGDYSGWTLTSGNINGVILPCNTCASNAGGIAAVTTSGNSGATWSAGVDNCTGQPSLAPGGGVYSLCLNDASTGGKMQEIKQTFAITAANNVFTYQYLAVLQDGGHAATDQPYFMSRMLDGSGAVINCTYVLQSAAASISGWTPASGCPGTNYKGWVTVTLDMTSYIGQNVTIEFLVSDCNQGGHYGYCYIDASCNQIQANNTVTICPGSTQLCGPAGFNTYSWSGPVTGNTMCLNTSTAGSYTLVTTGQCPAPTRFYTVTISPTPTVNFSSTVTPCNNTVPFTDLSTVSGGATITGWSWAFGDAGTSTVQNPSHTYAGTGTFNVVLTCTSSVGCVSSFTAPVTIGTGPTSVFTANTVCPGVATAFTNTSTGGTTYNWSFGDGNTSTATNPSHTYSASGTYVATLTVNGTGTCVATSSQTVTVSPLPTVTATGNSICNGAGPVNITGGGASTYTWDNGSTANPQSVNPAVTTNYTVIGTSAAGCVNTATCTVNVISNPTVTVANTSICPGGIGTLTASTNGTTFVWTGPNITSSTTTSVITANPAATSTYSVVASAGTCTISTTAQIIINPSIVPTFSATTVCEGQATQFTNTTAGVATYTWTYGDSNPANTTIPNPTNTYSAAGSYVATFSVINSSGCSGMSSNTITVNANPVPAFTSSTPCIGTAVAFANTTPATPTISTYTWDFGDGNGSTVSAPTNNYAAAGIYSTVLTETTTAGCVGSFSASVFVHPNPVSSFSNTTVCLNTTPTGFTDQSTLVNPAGIADNITTWAWTFGDGNTSATSSPTNPYATCGTFTASLLVTTNNFCTNTSSVIVTVNCLPVLTPPVSPTVCPNSLQTPGAFVIDIPGSTATWTAATTATGVSAGGMGTVPPYTTVSNVTGSTISDVIAAVPTSPAGCIGLPQTFTVNVSSSPVPAFTSSTPCMGTAVAFTNNTPAVPTISTYTWDFGDGNGSAVAAPTNNYAAAGIYTTVLTETTTAGCVGSFSASVFVHPNPVSSFSNTTVCLNTGPTEFTDQSTLTNPTGITDNITTWAWTFGDGNTSATASPTNPYATCGTFTASLLVTTNNFCTSTSSVVVTVNCVPVLTPPASPTVCPNTTVTPGAFTVDTPGSTVGWNAGSTVTGVSASGSGTVLPYTSNSPNLSGANVSDVITAIPTSPAGCIGLSETFTITVYPTPIMNPMPDITACDFQTVNVAPFGSFPAGSTFNWNNSNTAIGLAATGTTNIAPFAGQTGGSPTSVVATVSVTPTLNGCVGPDSIFVITISPQPTLALTSPSYTCPGSPVLAPTYTLNPNDPSTTFAWTNSNINTGMAASGGPTIPGAFTAPANATLANVVGVVTVVPTLGTCVGSPATYTVTIYPTPLITPSIINVEYCPNVTTNSIAISMIPASGGVQVYTWIDPSGPAIGLTTTSSTVNIVPSFTTVNTGTTAVTSQVIVNASLDGCLALPVTFNFTVNPNPIAIFNESSKVCLGTSMSFTDASTVGSGSVTQWGWDFNNDGVYTDALIQNPQFTFAAPAGTHTVSLQATTNKGCKDDTTKTVYVNYIPVPQFAGDVLMGCPIHPVNYTENSTVTGPAQINSWSWNFGNGTIFNTQTAGNYPATVFYNNTSAVLNAYYMVNLTVTTDSGCTASLTNTNYITVYPHPIAAFSWGPQDPEADVENPVVYFVDQSVGAAGPSTSYGPNGMLWNLGDVFLMNPANNYINNIQNPVHTYEHYDPYIYTAWQWVVNTHGCKDSVKHDVEIQPNSTFYIPNAFSPNQDGVNDGFKGTGVGIDNSTYNLWIFDRWGMQIFYANDMEKTWDGRIQGHANGNIVQEDVYVWKVKFSDFRGRKHEYKGTVSVIK